MGGGGLELELTVGVATNGIAIGSEGEIGFAIEMLELGELASKGMGRLPALDRKSPSC